ncbi:MAG: transcriptional repressor [Mailhella sp.]|nr:transcriptional repressor [Mailhella sp.]
MEKNIAEIELKFSEYLKRKGLRVTPQRMKILNAFLRTEEHVSMEELFLIVRKTDSTVGQVTVYRTLKLLCEAGIASAVNFEEGLVRYEPRDMHHHDHLVCEKCGRKIEFVNEAIEQLQEAVCHEHDFLPTAHHMVLYGICSECRSKE